MSATCSPSAAPRVSPDELPLAGASRRDVILVVDDEALIRRAARRVLERAGFAVREAADGQEALALLENGGTDVTLVLSDVVMPVMNGVALAEAVRDRHPNVRLLLTSGHTERALGGAPLPADIPLLRKPWTVDELVRFVRDGLAS